MLNAVLYTRQHDSLPQLLSQLKTVLPDTQVLVAQHSETLFTCIKTAMPDFVFWVIDGQWQQDPALTLLEALPIETVLLAESELHLLQAGEYGAAAMFRLPLNKERLSAVLERIRRRRQRADLATDTEATLQGVKVSTQRMPNIPIPTLQGFEFIPVSDIQYVQADGSYSHIFLNNGKKLTVSRSLKQLELLLDNSQFIRTHQSFLVQYAYIKSLVKGRSPYLLLNSGKLVEISRSYKKAVFEFLLAGAYGAVE